MKVEDKRSNVPDVISSDKSLTSEMLYESKENFGELFDFSPMPTMIIGLYTGEILNVNQAFSALYRAEVTEMIGRNIKSILISSETFSKSIYEFVSAGHIRNLEIEIINEMKDMLSIAIDANPIEYFDKPCVIITFTDVSRYKETEHAFKTAQSKIDRDIQSKWHALEAVLEEIDGRLAELVAIDESMVKLTEEGSTTQLSAKRKDALEFSESLVLETKEWLAMESGDFELRKERFNIRDAIEEVHQLFRELRHDKRLEIAYHYEGDTTDEVLGDKERFKHLMITFYSCGFKYINSDVLYLRITHEGLKDDEMCLTVEIEDSGEGLEFEKCINECNNMLFSIDRGKINDTLGSIDHAVSMFILKEMKGELVEGINYFGNSMTQLILMFQTPADIGDFFDVKEQLQRTRVIVEEDTRKKKWLNRILLISDSDINRTAVDAILSRRGYDVTLTKNYLEGMDALIRNEHQYGMVLINSSDEYKTDEIIISMREYDLLDYLPIGIMVYEGEDFKGLHKNGLIQGILKKPVEAKELSIMVNNVMTGSVYSELSYSRRQKHVLTLDNHPAQRDIDDKLNVQMKDVQNVGDTDNGAEKLKMRLKSLIEHSYVDKGLYHDFIKYLTEYNFKAVALCDHFLSENNEVIDPSSQEKIKALIVQLEYDEVYELVTSIFGNEG